MKNFGLYDSKFEHDACGIGFVANLKGNKNHQTVSDALTVLENMEHRGACGCEENTGDGAGILLQTPHEFFFEECQKLGTYLPTYGKYGVGMVFFPKEIRLREECRAIFLRAAERLGLEAEIGQLGDKALNAAAARLADWRFMPNGSEGFAKAEVTAGGISTAELSSQTMAARKLPGLYAIGEAVDVTGWLGGYNFQWAWASARAAGQAI